MEINDKFGPIRKGLLELAVLQVISVKKVYAADIIQTLKPTEFNTQEGTLYPLLSRLRQEQAVDYEWVESEAGPPRKYYRLTEKGQLQLKGLKDYWKKINLTINSLGKTI
jgi:PadR family transcriptional regulator PadR